MSQRIASFLMMVGCAVAADAAVPDLNGGVWQVMQPPQALRTSANKEPPLLPEAKAIYRKNMNARRAGDMSFDRSEKCFPPGFPRILSMPGSLGRFEFLQRPDQIVIAYEWNREWRLVDMNKQPEYIAPQYAGRSQGHWEGNTLVIDSTDFVDATLLDNMGLPHSDALHIIERYTPSGDGRRMQLLLRIEDSKTFSAPWETRLELRRDVHAQLGEDECLERKDMAWGRAANAPK